jgi:DNA-binding beta-propeller fold protein YncE
MRRSPLRRRSTASLGFVLLVIVVLAGSGSGFATGGHSGARSPPSGPVAPHDGSENARTSPGTGPHRSSSSGPLSVQFTLSLLNGSVVAGDQLAPGFFHPQASAYDPLRNLWFVSNSERSVSVLDPSTLGEVARLSVPEGVGPLVVDALHARLYVGSSGVVYVFNDSSFQLVSQISLGVGYEQVASLVLDPDEGRLLVVETYNETGLLVDTSSDTVAGDVSGIRDLTSGTYDPLLGEMLLGNDSDSQIALFDPVDDQFGGTFNAGSGTIGGVALDASGVDLYAAGPGLGVARIDVLNGTVMARHAFGSFPSGLVCDPDTGVVIVGDPGTAQLDAFDAGNLTTAWSVDIPSPSLVSSTSWDPVEAPALGTVFLAAGFRDTLDAVSVQNHSVYRSLPDWSEPEAFAYDPACGCYAVVDLTRSEALLIDPATLRIERTILLPGDPTAIAYATRSSELFVTLLNPSNLPGLVILNGATGAVIANLTGLDDPEGIVYDPSNGDVYVGVGGSPAVAVINSSTDDWVTNITLSSYADGMAYVPGLDEIYVAAGNDVDILDAASQTLVTSVGLGAGTSAVAYDPVDGAVYVAVQSGAFQGNVTPINVTDRRVGPSVPALFAVGLAVDPASGTLFIANLSDYVIVVNVTANSTSNLSVGLQAYSLLWAPNGQLLDGDGEEGAIFDIGAGPEAHLYNATFSVAPFIDAVGGPVSFVTGALDPNGTESYTYSGPPAGCTSAGSSFGCTPTVAGTYSIISTITDSAGDTVTQETVLWVSASYTVWLNESGLPAGTPWNVSVSGVATPFSSSAPTVSTSLPNGTYEFAAASSDPSAGNPSGLFSVVGGSTGVAIDFAGSGFPVTFLAAGLPVGTPWHLWLSNGDSGSSSTDEIQLREANGSYTYSPSAGNTSWSATAGRVTVDDAPIEVGVPFQLVVYPITFTETGLSDGTVWNVSVGSARAAGSTASLMLSEPNGTYSFVGQVPSGGYAPVPGSVGVTGAPATATVVFGGTAYLVSVRESGLPVGSTWWLNLTGLLSLSSATAQIDVNLSDGSYPYTIGGPVAFTVTPASGSIPVDGGPSGFTVSFRAVGSTGPAPLIIAAYSAVPGAFSVGATVNISVEATGGTPPYSYAFLGLPTGCASSNRTSILCTPTSVGNSTVEITVRDVAGGAAFANVTVRVLPVPGSGPMGPSGGGIPGIDWVYLSVGLIAALVVAAAVLLRRRGRLPPAEPSAAAGDEPGPRAATETVDPSTAETSGEDVR